MIGKRIAGRNGKGQWHAGTITQVRQSDERRYWVYVEWDTGKKAECNMGKAELEHKCQLGLMVGTLEKIRTWAEGGFNVMVQETDVRQWIDEVLG